MRKFFKYISGASLWLAGLALSTHLLLPHDHHITDSFSDQDKNCPASNNKSGHHPGFPVHCHAFNDLASEKAVSYFIVKYDKCSDFNAGYIFDPNVYDLPSCRTIFSNVHNRTIQSFIPGLTCLRAPPSFT